MKSPHLSQYSQQRQPSAVRVAQIAFGNRQDTVEAINVGVGNVSLPMFSPMRDALFSLANDKSPFSKGVVKYSSSLGMPEANEAFLHAISASGFSTENLYSLITDGGSHAMELVILATCGFIDSTDRPLLVIDPTYSNYRSFAQRVGRKVISIARTLQDDGVFDFPSNQQLRDIIQKNNPSALLIIPYDNPTGQFLSQERINEIAQICADCDMWLISDEAYRELVYIGEQPSSVWGIDLNENPSIEGKRISIESTSKVWNACGLRIGAIVTDSPELHEKVVYENTGNLCASVVGQYVWSSILDESFESLQNWFNEQRNYYKTIMDEITGEFKKLLPKIIITQPQSALYSVVDVRNYAPTDFRSKDFVHFCASEGAVEIDGTSYTLLIAPMVGFYDPDISPNHGNTQMRIAYVESPERMRLVSQLFKELLAQYLNL
ncbi:pyridoxal phosphate-dependent aminotransferase [candidate division WWE3 bacterium]|uniref:Pyridoxal phosphate-dependent aminotransferase n=1 Tax=candidate division WWE3 bacterium TaxID=2053526 RepID=A0A955RPA3_UNCKA|nr:pyridoxal phosphate-dependent aminotransferase [candidate division WWE3 bacterium]